MDIYLEALGYLSQIVAILTQLKAAEKAGVGEVNLPPIYIHHHAATWELDSVAKRSTKGPKPPKP